ncbi:MAG TPA: HEAT repeat domain-containing protein [Gemmataceae bacterium]|nr:HEAT repeat domain-containing protein [Gemmataceae bacterium]
MLLRPRILFAAGGLFVLAGLGPVTPPAAVAQKGFFLPGGGGPAATTTEADAQLSDEQLLRTAGLSPDGPALVEFFKARTRLTAEREKLAGFIEQLGSKKAEEREKAMGELVSYGPLAVPQLRQATRDPDEPQVATAARKCLSFIESNGNGAASLPAAAARVLVQKKTPGAADALLDFLPFADDDNVMEEIKAALGSLATKDGKVDSGFLRALDDKNSSLRRAVVAEVLAQSGNEEVLPALRKLLADPRPVVRLRVALALAGTKDEAAVTTLINVLSELPLPLAKQAEEFLLNLAADQAPKAQLTDTPASRKNCRDAWAAWWKTTEGDATLAEFKKRTLKESDREKVLAVIKQMGDEDFNLRERAQEELQKMGSSVAPLLRQALVSGDEEIKKRAQKALDQIEKDKSSTVLPIHARLMAYRKPAATSEVLLAFLPFADEDQVFEEVRGALAAVAVRDGKADPLLVKALDDKLPVRRGVAAEALALGGAVDQRAAIRKLLKDPDGAVKLRVALALATARDRDAVPVLIDLMAELPFEKGVQAETFLRTLAGDQGPNVYLGTDNESRKKVKEAWSGWWKVNGATVDLARATTAPKMLGYTLLVNTDFNRVSEISLDGKTRWQLDGLQYPRDAVALPGDRVLVAEQNMNRVVEMNQKREILWQKVLNASPMSVQRLPNGNTFIITNNGAVEVTKDGKEVMTYNRNQWDIITGSRAPDGQFVILTNVGMIIRLDSAGKELKSFGIGQAHWMTSIEALPGGRVLVPQPNMSKVIEYDGDGKQVWEGAVQFPFSATRLPNGNTLVASPNSGKIVELNRSGRVVWEHKTGPNERPYRVRRR